MGGKVFAVAVGRRPALLAPRLNPSMYFILRDRIVRDLQKFFEFVACPPEAPGKVDYGDIDIVVAEPILSRFQLAWNELSRCQQEALLDEVDGDTQTAVLHEQLKARYHTKIAGLNHFAVVHPERNDCVVQLDLEVQPSTNFHWRVFMNSYGDFWNIVALSIRPYGFVMTDSGLYVVDSEIERYNKKQARTLATADPDEALAFLRLDPDEWRNGWTTEWQMFEHAARNRFFSPHSSIKEGGMTPEDKRRLQKRPSFARFCGEYIPFKAANGGPNLMHETREDVLAEALDHFNISSAFFERRQQWTSARATQEHNRELKAQRRRLNEANRGGYDQRWIDWFLGSHTPDQRRALSLDMDKQPH